MVFKNIKYRLAKRKELRFFKESSTEQVFTHIYQSNKWGDDASRSGKGSNLEVTQGVRQALPGMLQKLGADSMLDIPCGDFHWMQEIDLPVKQYLGADIVKELVEKNQELYGNSKRQFLHLDLIRDKLPEVDVIFCRECLVHLSFEDIDLALQNIKTSNSTYLFVTDFPQVKLNKDEVTGKHHSLNMALPPFNWGKPELEYREYNTGKRRGDKYLSVWKIDDLPQMQTQTELDK